jgi:hypothetical protein
MSGMLSPDCQAHPRLLGRHSPIGCLQAPDRTAHDQRAQRGKRITQAVKYQHPKRADEKIRKNIDTRAKIIPKTFFESSQVYGMQRDKNAKKCFEKQLTQAGEGVWLCL